MIYVVDYIKTKNQESAKAVFSLETAVNSIDKKLHNFCIKLSGAVLSSEDTKKLNVIMYSLRDYERIADLAQNTVIKMQNIYATKEKITNEAVGEMAKMLEVCYLAVKDTINMFLQRDLKFGASVNEKEEYIDKLENHKVKEEYKNLFNKKITNVFGDDFKAIDEQLIFILDELENIYLNQNEIISHDDLVFILSLVSIGVKKKLKDILFFSSIEDTENKEVFILRIIKNSKREMFLIKKRCNLINKAFTTLENINKSDISLKISLNETIQKYFFQKNNYENINILTLKSILALYFSKTLKGV